MLNVIQKIYIEYSARKFSFCRKFGEAIIILRYRKEHGDFPHGDEEYARVLNQGW